MPAPTRYPIKVESPMFEHRAILVVSNGDLAEWLKAPD